jgi:glutamate/aspartate transport system substrate-binding protein
MIRIAAAIAFLAVPALVHAQALDGALKKIRDTKTITIAYRTDAVPYSFNDEKSQPAGYTVDLCKRIVASIEQQLRIQGLKVNWVAATSANRMELVAKKQADMECGATTATLSRMEQVDFSTFVFLDGTGVLVRNDSGVKTFAELGGKRVAAIAGTTNEKALNDALKKRLVSATVVVVKNREEGLAALEAGKVEGLASDKLLILGLAGKVKDPSRYAMLPEDLSFEPLAIVLPRGDAPFRLAVNRALAQIYRSPGIVEVFGKWFGPLGNPSGLLEAMYFLGAIPE